VLACTCVRQVNVLRHAQGRASARSRARARAPARTDRLRGLTDKAICPPRQGSGGKKGVVDIEKQCQSALFVCQFRSSHWFGSGIAFEIHLSVDWGNYVASHWLCVA
jgi:hypothetical protein